MRDQQDMLRAKSRSDSVYAVTSLVLVALALLFASCSPDKPQTPTTDKSAAVVDEQAPVPATTRSPYDLMRPIPVDELSRRADQIIHGRVIEVTGAMEKIDAKLTLPISNVKLAAIDSWKGGASKTFEFKSFGAEINGLSYFSDDFPRFQKGEEVIVFLKDFGGRILPVAHVQGKFEIASGVVSRGNVSVNEFRDEVMRDIESK